MLTEQKSENKLRFKTVKETIYMFQINVLF